LEALCLFPSTQLGIKSIKESCVHLCATQLPNGLWPDHYLEAGSAFAHHATFRAAEILQSFPVRSYSL